jgi:hypothetical protein
VTEFLSGAIAMVFATNGLFFWRFWRKSSDPFYAMFAASFWIMALNRMMPTANISASEEGMPLFYIVRLAAFVLILAAIIHKNYSR